MESLFEGPYCALLESPIWAALLEGPSSSLVALLFSLTLIFVATAGGIAQRLLQTLAAERANRAKRAQARITIWEIFILDPPEYVPGPRLLRRGRLGTKMAPSGF